MKLAELLNVDTTKENWFKLLSKKGINPKTVNAVSKGGGSGDNTNDIKYYHLKVEYPDDVMSEYYFFASIYKLKPTAEAKEYGFEEIIGNGILLTEIGPFEGVYTVDLHYFGTIPFIKKGEVIYNSIEEYCVSTGVDFNSYFERITEEEFLNS